MRRKAFIRFWSISGAALLAAGLLTPARAQDADDQLRGVARISLAEGQVSVRRGDSGDWVAAIINAPLMTEDQIATGPNSRAEIEFDAANLLRMGGNAELRLVQLEANRYQMQLGKGTVTFRILRPSTANIEVDTSVVSVRPSKQGVYRIHVGDAGETQVISRAGEVEVFTPRGSQWVSAGQMMTARGSASDPEFQIVAALPVDEWDQWCDSRDRMFLQSRSAQYVPQGVYGAEDLDANGTWANVPPYGNVWQPNGVGAGWAPYGCGRWVWEDWYGWTWLSCDAWGWAPYHYGRWFFSSPLGWCWYPGVFGFRHWWSPALVGWFGFGGGGFGFGFGFGGGFGFGHIGWVPLAPFEVFHPWWGRGIYGQGFGRGLNVTNVNISNVYRNARVAGGISGMRAEDFQSGRFGAMSHFSGGQIGQAGLIRGQTPMTPNSAHLNFSDRAASNVPRTNMADRSFSSHQQASPAQRVPFSQQRAALGGAGTTGGVRGQSEAMTRTQSNPAGGGTSGWRRFGEPAANTRQNLTPQNSAPNRMSDNSRPPSAGGSNGWQRFGNPGSGSAPRYNAPSQAPRNYGGSQGAPSYNAPAPRYNTGPSYSAPRSNSAPAPHNSAPSYSAPRSFGGGGGGSHSSGGGGGHSSGGGGGHSSGGGGHHR